MSITETMNPLERFEAALALEPVDRHPVFPILVTAAPRLFGVTQAEAWRDHSVARDCIIKCHKEYGYDLASKPNYYYPQLPGKLTGAPVRNLIPGKQLKDEALYQIDERVLFPREDYDKIASLGWNGYWQEYYEKMSGKGFEHLVATQKYSNDLYNADMKICAENGSPVFLGAAVDSVLMAFSMSRTLEEFTMDLVEVPDKVEAAMQASVDDLIANTIAICKANGNKRAFIVLERGSGEYYRLDIFERFEWPFLQKYVDAFVSEGILPWMHLDTDWSKNIPYFKKLPKGKCVCDLDSSTDIFKAKEVLKGHMCISGDVPASLLSIGKPEEVEAYCKKLIDEVGQDGGFMLTSGCECPVDVKPENLRAMVKTGKNYAGKKVTKVKGVTLSPAADTAETVDAKAAGSNFLEGKIAKAIGELRYEDAKTFSQQAIATGTDPFAILGECKAGMDVVGDLFSSGEYFLSELIISAKIFKDIGIMLEPLLTGEDGGTNLGPVVIGTPEGDIHDIGKDIVATLFKASGFKVYDLGVDVPPKKFIAQVKKVGATIVSMSALITPTFEVMKNVVDQLKQENLRDDLFIQIGGGPTSEAVREYVGADSWTVDPKEAINRCSKFISANA